MGINTEKDIEANLQIGPTDQGMVRIFVTAGDAEIPMDFEIDEANDIAEEIMTAARAAAAVAMPQAMDRSLATPIIRPFLPFINASAVVMNFPYLSRLRFLIRSYTKARSGKSQDDTGSYEGSVIG